MINLSSCKGERVNVNRPFCIKSINITIMNKGIFIDDKEQAEELLHLAEARVDHFKKKLRDAQDLADKIKKDISQIWGTGIEMTVSRRQFAGLTWPEKVLEAIKAINRQCYSREIVEEVMKMDSSVSREVATKSVSSALWKLEADKKIVREDRPKQIKLNALKDWYDSDGTILEEYSLENSIKESVEMII